MQDDKQWLQEACQQQPLWLRQKLLRWENAPNGMLHLLPTSDNSYRIRMLYIQTYVRLGNKRCDEGLLMAWDIPTCDCNRLLMWMQQLKMLLTGKTSRM